MRLSIFPGLSICDRAGGVHSTTRHLLKGAFPLTCLFALLEAPAPVQAQAPAFVFVSRNLPSDPNPASRSGAIERASQGRLLVREANGQVRVLVDGATGVPVPDAPSDVLNPDVSYDGTRIVFAGLSKTDQAFRLFEINADGTGLRQVTHSDRQIDLTRYGAAAELFRTYDDVDPCYLPDGRFCFVSTRYPGVAPDGRVRTTNLYLVNADGSDLHRITTERFGADTPTVEPATGRIVYSRWWRSAQALTDPTLPPPEPVPPGSPGYGNIVVNTSESVLRGIPEKEFPGLNSWFLAGIDPDGTDLSMYSGFRLDREATQAHRPSFLPNGEVLALFIPRTPFLGYPRGDGLRRLQKGPSAPEALGGPQNFQSPSSADPAVVPPVQPPFYYASAEAVPGGRLLVTGARYATTRLDYGVYLQENAPVFPTLLYNLPNTAELDAIPLVARVVPPAITETALDRLSENAPRSVEEAYAGGGSFTFRCENIFFNAPVDVAVATAPPIGRRLAIEFYLAPQRTSPSPTDPPMLIRRMDVPTDGRIEVDLPAGVPLFEVLRRPDDTLALGRDGQIFHVGGMNFGRAGEVNACVGCHAGHSQLAVPEDPSWTNVAPSAVVRANSTRQASDPAIFIQASFAPSRLVDRRTDPIVSEWAAEENASAPTVDLTWGAKIRAREVVIRGTAPGAGKFGPRDQVIHGLTVTTFLGDLPVQSVFVTRDIEASGTHLPLDPQVEFDALRILMRRDQVTGLYEGEKGAALSEVEVIGQAAGAPGILFVRGDADCNTRFDITDAVNILVRLFLGGPVLCCEAGADVNDDSSVDISDPIALLDFMFIGGPRPPQPFPDCGASNSALACGVNACF